MKRLTKILSIVAKLVILTELQIAAQNFDAAGPLDFFTDVTSRLLVS
ncbi:MAG TPA: hypothetical protein VHG89_11995 [Verrucomicrobiae bacterium]|nr:hypothetical protein [Verrucomicrobiae bacterium]